MWPSNTKQALYVLQKPITDLRNPIWDWEWTTKAYLSHFALGFQLCLLVVLLILFLARWRGASKLSKWDFRRAERKEENAPRLMRAWYWTKRWCLERWCLGCRYQALFLDTFSFALRVAFFSGAIANLIDVDHAPMFYGGPDRVLHKLGAVLAGLVFFYCGARMLRTKDEYTIRRYALPFCLAFSVIVHVVEDYTLGWF